MPKAYDLITKKKNTVKKDINKSAFEGITNTKFEDYLSLSDFQRHPITETRIDEISKECIAWAQKDTSLRLTDFIDDMLIEPKDFYRWLTKYQVLKNAYDFAFRKIAARRDIGAATKKYDGNWIKHVQGYYDPIFREETERLHKLKEQINQDRQINVIMQIPAAIENKKDE